MDPTPRPVERPWWTTPALLDGLTVAAVVVDRVGTVVYANAAALDLVGVGHAELVGTDVRDQLFDAPDRTVVDDVLKAVLQQGSWTGELELVSALAGVQTRPTTWTVVNDEGGAVGAVVLVESEKVVARALGPSSRRLRRLAAVTEELLAAQSVHEVAAIVTHQVKDAAGATVASLSLLIDPETLSLAGVSGAGPEAAATYASYTLSSANPAAESARTRQVLHLQHEELQTRYPAMPPVSQGVRSMLCLPLLARGETIGVVALSLPGRHRIDDSELLYLRLLADTCAVTLDRIEAQRAAADREAKLGFLADLSARLLGALDYEETLSEVAEAAVPWFAEWCSVTLAEDGRLRSIAVAHAHPELEAELRELMDDYGPVPGDSTYAVLETGQSQLVPEISDEMLAAGARDDRQLELWRRLGLRSGLSCALRVGGRTFGVVTWVCGEDGRRYDEGDLAFAEDLAQRAATAIDSADLHSQVRSSALQLQRAVLPELLYDVPGLRTAVEYLPAGRTDAGGDFYDVIYLEDGRVAAFVGDVMGRGVAAASVMAQMRSAIRTLIAVDPAPTAVLASLDRVFEALHLEQLVTVVYAVADPALDHVEVINAGHPPPVLMSASGELTLLDHASTLILGVGGGDRAVRTATFRPGDGLLFYTDGLVERRGEDDDTAQARLLAALRAPAPTDDLQGWLSGVVEGLRDPTRDDDVAALLLVRDPD